MVIIYITAVGIIGGLIGWITNKIAVKLLFRPIHPVKIPITGWTIHGLIPKRKKDLARTIGEKIEQDFISMEDILEEVLAERERVKLMDHMKFRLGKIIASRTPSFLPIRVFDRIQLYVNDLIDQEGEEMLFDVIENISKDSIERHHIAKLVEERINRFPIYKLESIIKDVASRELKHIEALGGIIGFLIGVFQGFLLFIIL